MSHGPIHFLYDSTGHILAVTRTIDPFKLEDVVGLPAWHSLNECDALVCQAAILRCLQAKTPQTFDVALPPLGRWRTTISPCNGTKAHTKIGNVRMFGLARIVPDNVLRLTSRQREICELLSQGSTSVEIAKRLDLSRETIDNHRAAIAKRIGIKPWSLVAWCGQHSEWLQTSH